LVHSFINIIFNKSSEENNNEATDTLPWNPYYLQANHN